MGLIDESPYYLEILKLMFKNKSSRYISDYLKDNYNVTISHNTLSRFKRDNGDIASLIMEIEDNDNFIYNNQPKEIKFIAPKTSHEDIIETVNNEIDKRHGANEFIVNRINDGIDVLNLINYGLSRFEDADILARFFDDDDISLKDKMDMGLKLVKMGLDWNKLKETKINITNNNNSLSLYNTDLSELFKEPIDWSDNSDG